MSAADPRLVVDGKRVQFPLFRTWYTDSDLQRLFRRLLQVQTPEERSVRAPFSSEAIEEAFVWNATNRDVVSDAQLDSKVTTVTGSANAQALASNFRTVYSPGAVRHMLRNYGRLVDCYRGVVVDDPSAEPTSDTNFTSCLSEEFPADAAIVKTTWVSGDPGAEMPIYDMSASAIGTRLRGEIDDSGRGRGTRKATPNAASMYTVAFDNGKVYHLSGMHLVTKELRHWMWTSIFWGPNPRRRLRCQSACRHRGAWRSMEELQDVRRRGLQRG